jgi:hypothetical protein
VEEGFGWIVAIALGLLAVWFSMPNREEFYSKCVISGGTYIEGTSASADQCKGGRPTYRD